MKRRITVEQLQELTEEQQQRLREWWKPEEGDYYFQAEETKICHSDICSYTVVWPQKGENDYIPLLDIGHMIELLSYKGLGKIKPVIDCDTIITVESWDVSLDSGYYGKGEELCDALWKAVKQVL